MIEIFWLLKRSKEDLKTETKWMVEKGKTWSNRKVIQILVPFLTGLFIIMYFGAAIVFSTIS